MAISDDESCQQKYFTPAFAACERTSIFWNCCQMNADELAFRKTILIDPREDKWPNDHRNARDVAVRYRSCAWWPQKANLWQHSTSRAQQLGLDKGQSVHGLSPIR
jgi:hypothetical protein